MLIEPLLAAAITASVAAVSAYIAYRNRKADQIKLTRDLFNQFFSLMDERADVWFWLEELGKRKPVPSFEVLWKSEDEKAKFKSLYKVAGFWFLTHKLMAAGQLHRGLAASLFGYDLYYWSRQAHPIIEATRARDPVFPQVFEALESTHWLLPSSYLPPAQSKVRLP